MQKVFFFGEKLTITPISKLGPVSNERYENSTFYGCVWYMKSIKVTVFYCNMTTNSSYVFFARRLRHGNKADYVLLANKL